MAWWNELFKETAFDPNNYTDIKREKLTANINDYSAVTEEARRIGKVDALGIPTEEYWALKGGKPWWAAEVDDAAGTDVPPKEPVSEPSLENDGDADDPDTAALEGALNAVIDGLNMSSGGGGSAQTRGSGDESGKTEGPGGEETQGKNPKWKDEIDAATTQRELDEISNWMTFETQEEADSFYTYLNEKANLLIQRDELLRTTYRGYDVQGAQQAYQQAREKAAEAYGLKDKLAGTQDPDAVLNDFEQYLAGQGIVQYDTSENALLSQLTTVYAPQAGETFEAWAARLGSMFTGMRDTIMGDLGRLSGLLDSQGELGANNRIKQIQAVLDEIAYQSILRSQGFDDALEGMPKNGDLMERGYENLTWLLKVRSDVLGDNTRENMGVIYDPANAQYLAMYHYILQTRGSEEAYNYMLHTLPLLKASAGRNANGEGAEGYDPSDLEALFAQDVAAFPESADAQKPEQASLAFEKQRRIMEGPSAKELLYAVTTPEQQEQWENFSRTVEELLTPEQRQRIEAGENIEDIFAELDGLPLEKKALLIQNAPPLLSDQQKADWMFLGSEMLSGYDWETRQAVLARAKAKKGDITYEDLVDSGVCAPEAFWGKEAQFAEQLGLEYRLNHYGVSVDLANRLPVQQQMAEAAQFATMVVGAAFWDMMDRWLYGPELELLPGGDGRFNFGEPTGAGEGGQQAQPDAVGLWQTTGAGSLDGQATGTDGQTPRMPQAEIAGQGRVTAGASRTVDNVKPFELIPTHSKTLTNKEFNALVEDIQANGIKEPIKYVMYNGEMYVVDGHHRLLAAKKLGLTDIPIEEVILPYKGYQTFNDLFWSD